MNWLLLRGLAREQRHWGAFRHQLRERSDGRVLCLDLPGTGTEFQRTSPGSARAIAADLRPRWQAEASSKQRWGVIGLSLGGMIALEWMRCHADDFAFGVVINTSAGGLSAPHKRLRPGAALTLVKAMAAGSHLKREQTLLSVISNLHRHDWELAETWAGFARQQPIRIGTVLRQLNAALGFTLPPQPGAPLLVLASDADRMVDPTCSSAIARNYGAPLVRHPTAGHELPLDAPRWVIDQILDCAAARDATTPTDQSQQARTDGKREE